MARRKIRDEADAQNCLRALDASGLPLPEWARLNEVDGRSLSLWRLNLTRRLESPRPRPRLIELVPRPAPVVAARYVVRCGELEVEVGEDFDDHTLQRLLRVVAAC